MKNKKYYPFFKARWLLFLFLLQLSGCQTKETTPPPSPSPTITPTATPEAPLPPRQTTVPENSPKQKTVSQASTKIYDNIPERNVNLKLAINAINQTVLQPGDEFSFNQIVGDRTLEKGYREAMGFDENGEKEPTVGGGICQIATTLYMAAINGDFEITERHSHSHKVPYADSDHDATVSYGGYDFRFKNNRDKPVMIYVSTDETSVVAELVLQD